LHYSNTCTTLRYVKNKQKINKRKMEIKKTGESNTKNSGVGVQELERSRPIFADHLIIFICTSSAGTSGEDMVGVSHSHGGGGMVPSKEILKNRSKIVVSAVF
jgi:proteasome lid subunit RPN8/RPN11